MVTDRGIATGERVCQLSGQGYRYPVVGPERARHFDAENPVCIRTAANRGAHLRKVMSDYGREARPYCLSEERAAKKQGIVERFVQVLIELSGGLPSSASGSRSNRSGNASARPEAGARRASLAAILSGNTSSASNEIGFGGEPVTVSPGRIMRFRDEGFGLPIPAVSRSRPVWRTLKAAVAAFSTMAFWT